MTKEQAIKELFAKNDLSTAMLRPLGIPFEAFLRFAQADKTTREKAIERLKTHLSKG